jgi:hypothetical protein
MRGGNEGRGMRDSLTRVIYLGILRRSGRPQFFLDDSHDVGTSQRSCLEEPPARRCIFREDKGPGIVCGNGRCPLSVR